jgi:hypothetical protein
LLSYFEYLKKLGEVRAIRVVSTLVDGMMNHGHCDNDTTSSDMTYLPISMGYCQCYRWYLASLGYRAETLETGAFKISRDDGGDINNGELFVSYTTYYLKWKRDYPNLKVSRPVEDICNICYMSAP